MFAVVVVLVVFGWQQWGRTVVARPVYRIAVENIRVTPPPPWIHSDVRAEVVRENALHDITIFDKDATIRVYQAFELHPWVQRVKRVTKHPPAQINVELEYRRPMAWVEVPRGLLPGKDGGVIAVDQDAVVLPWRDFSPEHLADYLRISVPALTPCGLAGSPWGDPRVAGAARIAALLSDSWQEWKLFRIRVSTDAEVIRHDDQPVYELETRDRQCIVWGRAPNAESPNEPSATAKLNRLRQLLASSAEGGSTKIADSDLRSTKPLSTRRSD
jgi:hypothetical protein